MWLSKIKTVAATMTALFVVFAAGAGMVVSPEKGDKKDRQDKPSLPSQSAAAEPKTDLFGDPLLPGAIGRLGTIQHRFDTWEQAWTEEGRTIFACNRNRSLRWWDARTGKPTKSEDWPGPQWRRVHISPNAKILAAEEMSGSLTLWDVATGKCLRSYEGYRWHGDYPFAFSYDSRSLIVANWKDMAGILHHINIGTGERRTIGKHLEVMSLSISPDNKRLYTGGTDSSVRCWDVDAAKELWKIEQWNMVMALSPDGRTLVIPVLGKPALRFLDAATGRARGADKPLKASTIHRLRYSSEGDVLAIGVRNDGTNTNQTIIWDVKADKERLRLPGWCDSDCLSPDGRYFAAKSANVLQCFDMKTGKPLYPDTTHLGHTVKPTTLVYSPDGSLLASASLYEGNVRLWDVRTQRLRHTFRNCLGYPTGSVHVGTTIDPVYLLFAPDGKRLFVGDSRGEVSVWDTATGDKLRRFVLRKTRRSESLLALRLSSDGETFLAVHCVLPDDPRGKFGPIFRADWSTTTGKAGDTVAEAPFWDFRLLSPDGRLFLERDKHLYDFDNQIQLHEPTPDRIGSRSGPLLTFSSDGALVAAQLQRDVKDGESWKTLQRGLQIWEAATGAPVLHLNADHPGWLAFAPDNRLLALAGAKDIRIWDIARRKEVYRRPVSAHLLGRGGFGDDDGCPLVFSPDGRTLATALEDTTIALWDVSSLRGETSVQPPLDEKEQDALWSDLAGSDAAKAFAAIEALAARPKQTATMLRQRLHPIPTPEAEPLRRLLADLDSSEFARREAASGQLLKLRPLADAALRAALAARPSLEVRKRIESLLAERVAVDHSPQTLRGLRAIRALEQIDTSEARKLLASLAHGAPNARLTEAAEAAFRRLERRRR